MSLNLKILSLVFVLVMTVGILLIVRKGKMSLKYSIVWYACLFVLTLFILFPDVLVWVTKIFGIQVSSNFVLVFLIATLFIICISLTIIVSDQNEKIRDLIQEISILKNNDDFLKKQ
ncbi:MAG: DUF2304 domain-containing protein [Clostridia bacterium]|nr:DUF2304 domain-containing protein [Clostridia bacterium]